jgi:hypothetical protein
MIGPDVWGKYIWTSIHVIALAYPETPTEADKVDYKEFFSKLGPVLPCQKCSSNYIKHNHDIPIDFYLYNRDNLFRWTVELHNIVNKECGKPEWDYVKAYNFYSSGKFDEELIPKNKNRVAAQNNCSYANSVLLILNVVLMIVLFVGLVFTTLR